MNRVLIPNYKKYIPHLGAIVYAAAVRHKMVHVVTWHKPVSTARCTRTPSHFSCFCYTSTIVYV